MRFLPGWTLWAAVAWLTVLGLYAVNTRTRLEELGASLRTGINGWDAWLFYVSDPYLVCFFYLPVLGSVVAAPIVQHYQTPVLIRHGSSTRWVAAQARRGAVTAAAAQTPLFLIGFLSGTGLPVANQWSSTATTGALTNQVLHPLATAGAPPWSMVVFQFALLLVSTTALAVVLATVLVLTQRPWWSWSVLWAWMLGCIISFKGTWAGPGWLRPANTVLAHHGLGDGLHAVTLLVVPALAGAGCLALMFAHERRYFRPSGLRVSPRRIYAGLVALGGAGMVLHHQAFIHDPATALVGTFYGAAPGGFSMLTYGYSLITFLGLAYLAAHHLAGFFSTGMHQVLIRAGSVRAWAGPVFLKAAARTTMTLAALGAAILGAGALLAADPGEGPAPVDPAADWTVMVHQFLLNGVLQVLVYILVVFLAMWISGRTDAGLPALGALTVLAVPSLNPGGIFPAGLNAMGYTELGEQVIWAHTTVLGCWLAGLLALTYHLIHRRIPSFEPGAHA